MTTPASVLFPPWLRVLVALAALRSSVSFVPSTTLFPSFSAKRQHHKVVANPKIFRNDCRRVFYSTSGEAEDDAQRRRAEYWILLVDDEEPILTAVEQFLIEKGYKVTACLDGEAALKIATSQRDRIPDCIVSDIRMPLMDGLTLLRTIRKEDFLLSHIPFVLLTAKGMTQDRIAGYDSGADAYLTKPFSPEELVAIVDNLIERSENLRIEYETIHKDVTVDDLKNDLAEIKDLLVNKGGGGVGNGWVEQTNVFLSKDERAVLDFLSRGLMTKEIAAKTHLSTRRIEQLLTGMFRKTGVKNRTELVRWGVLSGNVD